MKILEDLGKSVDSEVIKAHTALLAKLSNSYPHETWEAISQDTSQLSKLVFCCSGSVLQCIKITLEVLLFGLPDTWYFDISAVEKFIPGTLYLPDFVVLSFSLSSPVLLTYFFMQTCVGKITTN